MPFRFEILARDPRTRARLGRITTPHGIFTTPVFMAVGTQASVKSVSPEELLACQVEVVLANTYHLFLRPGHALIRELADRTLVGAYRLELAPDGEDAAEDACIQGDGGEPLSIGPGAHAITAVGGRAAAVELGRFAPPSVEVGRLGAGETARLEIPPDSYGGRWQASAQPAGQVRICEVER
jgi:hypothetical protein